MRFLILPMFALLTGYHATGQVVLPLYAGEVPNSRPAPNEEWQEYVRDSILIVHAVTRPSIAVYLPPKEKRTGDAVVILPGGGYRILAAGHEGTDIAKAFVEKGIAAFVVKYRIPDDRTMVHKDIGPLQDAQRGIQFVRENARKWQIRRVGIMGFSAGGHLAATAGTHFQKAQIPNKKNVNLRPDFMVLVYPVISFQDSTGHLGSRENLIGKNPSRNQVNMYSNEMQVSNATPPAFIIHAKDDDVVKVENATLFAEALRKNQVPAELFLYEKGGHGFGMNNKTSEIKWMDKVTEWMKGIGNL